MTDLDMVQNMIGNVKVSGAGLQKLKDKEKQEKKKAKKEQQKANTWFVYKKFMGFFAFEWFLLQTKKNLICSRCHKYFFEFFHEYRSYNYGYDNVNIV